MAIPARPSYIQFYPTLSCNLSCDFCFNRQLQAVDDVKLSDFEKIMSTLSGLGIPAIDILGGEPTLHPDFVNLFDVIHHHGLTATASTNGSDARALETVSKKYGNDSVRIGISVNSEEMDESLHQYILTYRPVLKSVFGRYAGIQESVKSDLGLAGIEYYLLFMDVVDQADLKNSLPFYDYYEKLEVIKRNTEAVDGVFCSGFLPDTMHYPELDRVRCPAGTTKLSMLPDGRVYPCYLLFRYPEFELGNILTDDFDWIWGHPVLYRFRRFERNNCPNTGCGLFNSCHGGCPAMSYHFYKELHGPDPRCMEYNNFLD